MGAGEGIFLFMLKDSEGMPSFIVINTRMLTHSILDLPNKHMNISEEKKTVRPEDFEEHQCRLRFESSQSRKSVSHSSGRT